MREIECARMCIVTDGDILMRCSVHVFYRTFHGLVCASWKLGGGSLRWDECQ